MPSLVEIKLAQWFWRKRFLNFVNVFSPFRNYFPFEKSGVPYLNKIESPSPKDDLCQVWLKLAQWFFRIKENVKKFMTMTTTTTDNGQISIGKSSLKHSPQMSDKIPDRSEMW